MTKCKTCRYWQSGRNGNKRVGVCDRIGFDDEVLEPAQADEAEISYQANDDAGLFVSLVTKETFGCTMWVSK